MALKEGPMDAEGVALSDWRIAMGFEQ